MQKAPYVHGSAGEPSYSRTAFSCKICIIPSWPHSGPPQRPSTIEKRSFACALCNVSNVVFSWPPFAYPALCWVIFFIALGHLGAILKTSRALLGPSWNILAPLGGILGPFWGHLEILLRPLRGHLGQSWRHLGPPWGDLGPARLYLKPFWALLKPSRASCVLQI